MNLCTQKAKEGDLLGLYQARHNKHDWDTKTCWIAAKYGNLQCLQYAHENGCPWDAFTLIEAIKNNHIACFLYALENGCPHTSVVTLYLAREGNVSFMKKCLQKGVPLHTCAIYESIKHGHLAMVEYLYLCTGHWDSEVSSTAVKYGDLAILAYVMKNDCPYYADELVEIAIERDQPHCLRWILTHLYHNLCYDDFVKIERYAVVYQYHSLLLLLPFLNEVSQLFLSETSVLYEYLPSDLVHLMYEYV